jgi:hypothetical protein
MTDSWVGEGAEGRVRVELDSAGRVRDITLGDGLSRAELREALIDAFHEAQDAAHADFDSLPSAQRLAEAAAEVTAAAERRFAEISSALYDLDRRAEREW